jgi:hypothetical protein
MTDDHPPIDDDSTGAQPVDDDLVSAVLDGEATSGERALVEGSPEGRRRLEELRAAAAAVPPLEGATADALIARALDAAPTPVTVESSPTAPSVAADELVARRRRRDTGRLWRRRRAGPVLRTGEWGDSPTARDAPRRRRGARPVRRAAHGATLDRSPVRRKPVELVERSNAAEHLPRGRGPIVGELSGAAGAAVPGRELDRDRDRPAPRWAGAGHERRTRSPRQPGARRRRVHVHRARRAHDLSRSRGARPRSEWPSRVQR